MRCSGLKCFGRKRDRIGGAVTIAELLLVLVLSSIVLVLALHGQAFIRQLSGGYFENVKLETEGRLLLRTLEADITVAEALLRGSDDWILQLRDPEQIHYRFTDSALTRNGESVIAPEIKLFRFEMWAETLNTIEVSSGSVRTAASQNSAGLARVSVEAAMTLTHGGRSLDLSTRGILRRRSPYH